MVKGFTTAARRQKPLKFVLDGVDMTFTPPKQSVTVMAVLEAEANGTDPDLAETKAGFDWLRRGLGDESYSLIKARLLDNDDDLDIADIRELVSWMQETISGRPTG